MLVIHATMRLDPDRRDEALGLFADLAAASREEPGVIDYTISEDIESPGTMRFVERYEDRDALAAHQETDHYRAFDGRREELLDGPADVTMFEIADATDL
jgi:quinol monooxygenase YgiN